jgi:tripartite ATP-independent transporter DctP family solute receptor
MQATYTGRQFHNQPEESHAHGFLRDLWQAVRTETDGAVDIEVCAQNGNVPGSDPQALDMLVSGELQFFCVMGGLLGRVVPVAEIQGLPFTYQSHAQVHQAIAGDLGDFIRAQMRAQGIYGFRHGVMENGFRHIGGREKPVNSVDDLAGYRMRIPAGQMFEDLFNALGATPVMVNIRELPAALREGRVDGQENPLVITEVNRLYETCKYMSLTGHLWSGFNLIANLKYWESLPEHLREVIERNVKIHIARQRAYTDAFNASLETKLAERGMIFNRADAASFRRVLAGGFYKRWKAQLGQQAWSLLEGHVGTLT